MYVLELEDSLIQNLSPFCMPRQEPMKSVASAIFYSMDSTLSADFIKILLAQIFKTVFYQVPKI